jgi:uncharacterized membrane protein YccF (DUF307 family)
VLATVSTIVGVALLITLIGIPIGLLVLTYGCWPAASMIINRVDKRARVQYKTKQRRDITSAIGPDLYPWEAEDIDQRSMN